jgi:hypothetical protein
LWQSNPPCDSVCHHHHWHSNIGSSREDRHTYVSPKPTLVEGHYNTTTTTGLERQRSTQEGGWTFASSRTVSHTQKSVTDEDIRPTHEFIKRHYETAIGCHTITPP